MIDPNLNLDSRRRGGRKNRPPRLTRQLLVFRRRLALNTLKLIRTPRNVSKTWNMVLSAVLYFCILLLLIGILIATFL